MRTIKIDILNEKALNLLRNLELLKLIRLHKLQPENKSVEMDWTKYKGLMSRQPLNDVDQQLNELRNEWD